MTDEKKPDAEGADDAEQKDAGSSDEKKIVDESWKAEAQREKEELGKKLQDEADKARAQPLPPAEFLPFVSGIAAQALMQLGAIDNPIYGKKIVDLDAARYSIDIIGVLEEKTRGNLTPEEEKYLKAALHDLRMRYVSAAQGGPEKQQKDAD